MITDHDTIVAAATAAGGALSLIRVSGPDALRIVDGVFRPVKGPGLSSRKGFTIAYGEIMDSGRIVDDVLVSVFRTPNSYTGEDMTEISCHGSQYIVRQVIELLIKGGARSAGAGEFTSRAFLAGKMDLSQAEAVADMISSHDRATHTMAVTQMKGGYSDDLGLLRAELLRLASLLELELDFSEEDVEFADRGELLALVDCLIDRLFPLIDSFSLGNAVKEGIGVAIVGSPNAGKSTLLNALLKEDRAIVSDIVGTTRDVLEERMTIGGVEFRFIDTAGIRNSDDVLEQMGVERTYRSVEKASVILYMVDAAQAADVSSPDGGRVAMAANITEAIKSLQLRGDQKLCVVLNKSDKVENIEALKKAIRQYSCHNVMAISAKYGENVDSVAGYLSSLVDTGAIFRGDTVVSNARHYEALLKSAESLGSLRDGINVGLSGDLLAQDIRQALYWLGTVTGEITTDEILGEIFSKFCIGK